MKPEKGKPEGGRLGGRVLPVPQCVGNADPHTGAWPVPGRSSLALLGVPFLFEQRRVQAASAGFL